MKSANELLVNLPIISEEEVQARNIALNQLWLVQVEDKLFGPFEQFELRNCVFEDAIVFEDAKVCNIEDETWMSIFKARAFQRRKPQLVSQEDLTQQQHFHIIVNGHKEGPFGLEELQAKFEAEEIKLTDSISTDNGHNWTKLYLHPEFNRRDDMSAEDLPFGAREANNIKLNQPEHDAHELAGLVYLNHKNEKDFKDLDIEKSYRFYKENSESMNNWAIASIAAFCLVAIGSFYFLQSSSTQDKLAKIGKKAIKRSVASTQAKDKGPKKVFKPVRNNVVTKPVVRRNVVNRSRPKPLPFVRKSPIRNAPDPVVRRDVDDYVDESDRFKDPRDEYREPAYAEEDGYVDERYPEREVQKLQKDVFDEDMGMNTDAAYQNNDF